MCGLSACAGPSGPLPTTSGSRSTTAAGPVPDGHYRVQAGDNLYRIGLRFGQSVATLAAWNQLSDPGQIEVGQILRVRRGGAVRPRQASPASQPPATNVRSASVTPVRRVAMQWPVQGPILSRYNGATQKGIDIGGSRGTPVRAAAPGTVLYAGDAVRGYGNLVLIRHSHDTLTAYAHNDSLRVRKDQQVQAGDVIAAMGDSGSDRVKLHFEVRVAGKAVNPLPYLPQ